ncbi:hypothetical protein D3C87_395060 [compost metagenome]
MSTKLNIEPRVRSLVSYLGEIENGVVQIPSFQRDYVWSRDDIKDLFDSIKNRYPIGSVLFWKPEIVIGPNKEKIGSYFIPQNKDTIYILDGFQRLSTLFGCLTNPYKTNLNRDEKEWSEYFKIYYDLEDESFVYLRPKSTPLPYQVPLFIFMNSSDFRQYARREFEKITDESKIDLYYDRADKLSRIFLEYQIASIDINNANIEEAVEIFSRVNSKGQDISFDWMANALSIKDGFRFGSEIDNLLEDLKQYNFDKIDRNVIFRCIQSSFGKLYIDNPKIEILARRSDFSSVTKETIPKIRQAVKFLFEELMVLENKLLPYNIQLIFIVDFFKKFDIPSQAQISELKKWFWTTTYANYFTIYSLANQRRAYEHFQKFLNGEESNPVYNDNPTISFTVGDFPDKISMGSVRAKALTLFMLNYGNNFASVNSEEIVNYKLNKIYSSMVEPENFIPTVQLLNKLNEVNRKSKDLSLALPYVTEKFLNENFITSHMVNSILNDKSAFLSSRKFNIMNAEKNFVESLNMDYGIGNINRIYDIEIPF